MSESAVAASAVAAQTSVSARLLRAKRKFLPLVKSAENPHFRSKYADLATIHESTTAALLEEGLLLRHEMIFSETSRGEPFLICRAIICTADPTEGVLSADVPVGFFPSDPQKQRSGTTYARRLSEEMVFGLAAEDDDGNAASAGSSAPPPPPKAAPARKVAQPPPPAPAATSGNPGAGAGAGGEATTAIVESFVAVPGTTKAGKPYVRFDARLDNGGIGSTFSESLGAQLAEGCTVTIEPDSFGGRRDKWKIIEVVPF